MDRTVSTRSPPLLSSLKKKHYQLIELNLDHQYVRSKSLWAIFAHLRLKCLCVIYVCITNDGDSAHWKKCLSGGAEARQQPGIASDFQVSRSFREEMLRLGSSSPIFEDKGDRIDAAGRPVFQQWHHVAATATGTAETIRLLVFSLMLFSIGHLKLLTFQMRKPLIVLYLSYVCIRMRALGRRVNRSKRQGQGKKTFKDGRGITSIFLFNLRNKRYNYFYYWWNRLLQL